MAHDNNKKQVYFSRFCYCFSILCMQLPPYRLRPGLTTPLCHPYATSLNLRIQRQPRLGKGFLNLISYFCRLFSHRGLSFCRFINLFASSLPNHLWVVLCVLIGRAFPQRGRVSDLLLEARGHPNQDPFQPPQGIYLEAGVPGSVSTV